jgi:raffinose/stachyose/melibiose transport system substrate-binding protein
MKRKWFFTICSIMFVLTSVVLFSCNKKEAQQEGPVDIVIWGEAAADSESDPMIDSFNASHSDIHITLNLFSEVRDLIKPAINSGEGPDFFNYDTGPGYLGVLVSSGLALDLTSYVEQYKWEEKFLDWALGITTYNGKLFGIAHQVEMLGVYYNKKVFAENNISLPKSYDDFLNICKTLQAKGLTPVLLDDKEHRPGFHYESIWMNIFAGPQKVKDALAGKIKWTDPDLVLAMNKFSEFAQGPYVNKQINSFGYDDANALYYSGGAVMRVTGTWMVENMVKNMGDDVGFFYMPPGSPGIPDAPPGGFGGAMVVNGKTKHPDETVFVLDWYFGPDACKLWYERGFIPTVKDVDYSSFNLSGLFKDVLGQIESADEMGTNIDVVAGPKVNLATQNYVQQLIDGVVTGQKAMELKQKAQEEDIAAGDV